MSQQTIKPRYTIATNRYGHYCIPLSSAHRPCAQTILAGEVHEPDTIQFILDNAGDGDVIHAGAYFGDMLPALSTIKGRCWAFEPEPLSFTCAKATLLINGFFTFRVQISEQALGHKNGWAFLQNLDKGKSLGGGSKVMWITEWGDESESEEQRQYNEQFVRTTVRTIDSFDFSQSISIIHLDIESSEFLALAGAEKTISRYKPILILEALPDDLWADVVWAKLGLTELGYKITGKVHGNSILECVK